MKDLGDIGDPLYYEFDAYHAYVRCMEGNWQAFALWIFGPAGEGGKKWRLVMRKDTHFALMGG